MLELNKIHCGDCIETLKKIESNSIDSIVTDPPYELGFMGKKWDNTGIANNVELWAECLRILKPGGHLLAFSGTRTYHRMASAIEDAGFEVRDMIEWVYGSGFPKSLNIGKQVDRLQGNEREIIGKSPHFDKYNSEKYVKNNAVEYAGRKPKEEVGYLTKGTSEYEGWGTALKPAHEPICMARKPLAEKTVAENCLKYGTGGINIDGSRVETKDNLNGGIYSQGEWVENPNEIFGARRKVPNGYNQPTGRFPANVIHDGSDEVTDLFPNDSQRFFYCAKASKSERNAGLDGFEEKENAGSYQFRTDGSLDGKPTNPKANFHPTVKPIALMEYLIKMVTPKNGIVIDPFGGSGTTGLACQNLNRNFILIEKEPEYCKIAEKRLCLE